MKRLALCLSITVLFACSKEEGGGGKGGRRGGARAFPVETMKVEARAVEYKVDAVGSLEAHDRVQITARVAGVVEKLRFREGDKVPAGQSLAEIDPDRYRTAMAAAQASLERARANEADARAALSRREGADSESPGLISKEEVESTRTRVSVASAEVSQARAAVKQAELDLRDAYARTAMAGVIETRNVELGQYVQPGTVLATLVKRDPMRIRFQVPEAEASQLKPGMKARFRIRNEEKEYEATLTHVAQSAETASRMVQVIAEVTGPATDELRPGAFAEVVVPVGSSGNAAVIPQLAIRPTEKGFVAFVLDGTTARERVLTLGMRTGDGMVEVRAGLTPGDELVVRGADALTDGVTVTRAEAAPAPQKPADQP
jgi:RND family efflux transporter MFP subunit